jgi:hypothetical protein
MPTWKRLFAGTKEFFYSFPFFLRRLTFEILTISSSHAAPKALHYDPEWLAVLKSLDYIDASCSGNVEIPVADKDHPYDAICFLFVGM